MYNLPKCIADNELVGIVTESICVAADVVTALVRVVTKDAVGPVSVLTVSVGSVAVTVTKLIKELNGIVTELVSDVIKLGDTAAMELVTAVTAGILDKADELAAVALVVTGSEAVVATDSSFPLLLTFPSPFFPPSVSSLLLS